KIKTAHEELSLAYSAAGASLYQNAEGTTTESPSDGATADAPPAADEAVEADYEIVEDAPKSE
ncbi:MAG: hypothetical protein ABI542_11490, partial [Gemmatimonadota bacterium]